MHKEQEKVALHEKPKILVEDIARKISDLDREVKYLLNKLKTFRPKPKPKPENKTDSSASDDKANDTRKPSMEKEGMVLKWLISDVKLFVVNLHPVFL